MTILEHEIMMTEQLRRVPADELQARHRQMAKYEGAVEEAMENANSQDEALDIEGNGADEEYSVDPEPVKAVLMRPGRAGGAGAPHPEGF